jgi:hypothetical protein
MQIAQAAHLALGQAHVSVLDDEAIVKLLHLGPRMLDGHALAARLLSCCHCACTIVCEDLMQAWQSVQS